MKRFLVFAGSFREFEPMGGRFLGETDSPDEAMALAKLDSGYDWYTVYDRHDRSLTSSHSDHPPNQKGVDKRPGDARAARRSAG
ncbi:MAG: hypothetical protein ACOCTG_06785 [Bacteroidota bacterium]